MAGRRPMQPVQVKTMSESFREVAKEKDAQAVKRKRDQERMAAMAAKLAAAQKNITDRVHQDTRRVNEEESEGRRKYIEIDEQDDVNEGHRAAKRAKIEASEREKTEANFAEMVRRREHWESKKTRDCGDWRRDACERGDGCKFRHNPANHPRYNEYIEKKGQPPPSILHFMNFLQ